MIKKSKRAALPLELVIVLALLAFFLVMYTLWYFGFFGKNASSLNDQFIASCDADQDNIPNVADKCPCVFGVYENDGCPSGYKITGDGKGKENRDCFKEDNGCFKKT